MFKRRLPFTLRAGRPWGKRRGWRLLTSTLVIATAVFAGVTPAKAATFSGFVDASGVSYRTHTFTVTTAQWQQFSLDWDNSSAKLNLGLKDPSGKFVKWATGNKPETITWDLTQTGTWTLAVTAKSGSANYTITTSTVSAPATCTADFCGTVDAAGIKSRTYPVTFNTTGTATITLDWSDSSAALNLGLKDPTGTAVKWAVGNKPEVIVYPVNVTGTWTVVVVAKAGASDFTVTVNYPQATTTGTVSGAVWVDANGNGVRDTGEQGLPALTVKVVDVSSGSVVSMAATAANGQWSTTAPGGSTYRVLVPLPPGYSYGSQGSAPAPAVDSTINPASGTSASFSLASGGSATANAGAVPTGHTTVTGTVTPTQPADSLVPVRSTGGLSISVDWANSASAALSAQLLDPTGKSVGSASGANPLVINTTTTMTGSFTLHVTSSSLSAQFRGDLSGAALQGAVAPRYTTQVGGSGRATMYPSGLDVAPDGTIYVADTGNDGVQAYNADGTRKWSHLSWGRANGQFSEPRDVAFLNGKVYVADTGNNRIQVLNATDGSWLATWPTTYTAIMGISAGVDGSGNSVILGTDGSPNVSLIHVHDPSTGAVLRTIGSGFGSGNGQLNEPRDAATDSSGRIYVADFRNHRVAIFTATGAWVGSFGSLGSAPGQFNGPYGIDLDSQNNIYVTDANNSRIQEFSPNQTYLTSFGSAGSGPGQFFQLRRAVVGSGLSPLVYGADLWADKISVFNQDGTVARELGGVRPPLGGFNKPYGMSMDSGGNLYVADTTNQRIQVFDPSGTYLRSWGTRGFGDTVDGLNWPHDVTLDPTTGTVWVADTKNNRLVQYTTSGTETGHRIGTLGTGPLQMHWPDAVTTTAGDLIVADTWNNRVMRITPGTTAGAEVNQWTTTGLKFPKDVTVVGAVVYVADDLNKRVVMLDAATGAIINTITDASIHDPQGVTVDATGDIWVSDTSWNRLLDFTPAGTLRQIVKPTGAGSLYAPGKLMARRSGGTLQLYAIDTGDDRVAVFTLG